MKKQTKIIGLMLLTWMVITGLAAQQTEAVSVIPKPKEIAAGNGFFNLQPGAVMHVPSGEARKSAALFNTFLKNRYGLQLQVSGSGEQRNGIQVEIDPEMAQESYQLSITPDKIMLKGGDSGVFYGFQTLLQLVQEKDGKLLIPGMEIKDSPEFEYRGLMIDVSRHFRTLEEMKLIVDLMAHFKFNRLHWHLTDDQGWRLEIKKYPKLTEVSAWRDGTILGQYYDFKPFIFDQIRHGGYYTQDEAKELVAYAAERKITVIPEIELPGHSSAVLAAYPQFGSFEVINGVAQKGNIPAKDEKGQPYNNEIYPKVPGYWGVHYNIFGPKEETFRFLEDVLTEVMKIFPSEYIHIGGDEVPKDHWITSEIAQRVIKKNKLRDEHELQSYFIKRIEKFLNKNGRNLIGWDEILEGGLAPNATVMSWRGEAGGIAAAKMNHDVIMTPNSHLYLDHGQGKQEDEPLFICCNLPLEKVYSYYPRPESLTEEQQKHILGVQANMWTEYVPSFSKMEYMLFPRVLALAEVAWLPKEMKDYEEFISERLPKRLAELGHIGVNYRIPEAKVEISQDKDGKKVVYLKPLVAGSQIYYSYDGHKADRTAHLYNGPIIMPEPGEGQDPLKIHYTIITPDNRESGQFAVEIK